MGYFNQNPLPPKFGKTPLELLSEKTVDPPSLASAWGFQTGMGLLGAGCHLCKNWIYRRPFISGNLLITIFSLEMFNITIAFVLGIQMYPIYFVAAFTAGNFFLEYRRNYWAERDAVLRHYIELHPEDFPAPGNDRIFCCI